MLCCRLDSGEGPGGQLAPRLGTEGPASCTWSRPLTSQQAWGRRLRPAELGVLGGQESPCPAHMCAGLLPAPRDSSSDGQPGCSGEKAWLPSDQLTAEGPRGAAGSPTCGSAWPWLRRPGGRSRCVGGCAKITQRRIRLCGYPAFTATERVFYFHLFYNYLQILFLPNLWSTN